MTFESLLSKNDLRHEDLVRILKADNGETEMLIKKSSELRLQHCGNEVYLRGLIEITNTCAKDCFYCGIRKSTPGINRYTLTDEEVLASARFAYENEFGSIVIQGGELISPAWTTRVEHLLKEIKKLSNGKLGVTLSLGEQSRETYERWLEAGAHRYLLRFETSDFELYKKIHPNDILHDPENRMRALQLLKECGYQVGSGVMVGLPWQSYESMAGDLLMMKALDIDMCGLGPYIEHHETPLFQYKNQLMPLKERFELSLRMIAALRLLINDINIAATTAMETIDPLGRIKAFKAGANVVMPNITPEKYQDDYLLYDNKVGTKSQTEMNKFVILKDIFQSGYKPGLNKWGDSRHFGNKQNKNNNK